MRYVEKLAVKAALDKDVPDQLGRHKPPVGQLLKRQDTQGGILHSKAEGPAPISYDNTVVVRRGNFTHAIMPCPCSPSPTSHS